MQRQILVYILGKLVLTVVPAQSETDNEVIARVQQSLICARSDK